MQITENNTSNLLISYEVKKIDVDSYINNTANHYVTTFHDFVNATANLSLYPMRILYFLATTVSSVKDDVFYTVELSATELAKILNIEGNSKYEKIKKALIELQSAVMIKEQEKDVFETFNIMFKSRYNRGKVTLIFHPDMSRFLLHVVKPFTNIPYQYFLKMKTPYGIRLLHFLLAYHKINYNKLSEEDKRNNKAVEFYPFSIKSFYKIFFGDEVLLNKSRKKNNEPVHYKYNSFRTFNNDVLKPAIKQINDSKLLNVEVKYIKDKKNTRKIGYLQFITSYGEDNEKYKEIAESNKQRRITEERTRKINGNIDAVARFLYVTLNINKTLVADYTTKYPTVALKVACIAVDYLLNYNRKDYYYGNDWFKYSPPDSAMDTMCQSNIAVINQVLNAIEEFTQAYAPAYDISKTFEENITSMEVVDAINAKFSEIYDKYKNKDFH